MIINAIHGTGPNDIYVAGTGPAYIYHWDGVSWDRVYEPPHQFTGHFSGIFAINPDRVWAVGSPLLLYNGVDWIEVMTAPNAWYGDVWAFDENDVYFAAGTLPLPSVGSVVHLDGSGWTQTVIPGAERLTDIWGSSPANMVATGGEGTVVYYDACGSITTGIRD